MLRVLAADLAALFIYMSLWWLLGKQRQRLDVVDTAWGGGFVVAALVSFVNKQSLRTELVGLLVLIWAARLAKHIWQRSGQQGLDPRYEELSAKWNKTHFWLRAYLSIFLLQGVLILVIALPIAVAGSVKPALNYWQGVVATLLWLTGFIIESIADRQLKVFKTKSNSKGKVLTSGLWHYSRHPNYFGELVQWWSIGILALGGGPSWLSLIGPFTLSTLIIFISGIPSIEKRHLKDLTYQEYKRHTSPLIPWFKQ